MLAAVAGLIGPTGCESVGWGRAGDSGGRGPVASAPAGASSFSLGAGDRGSGSGASAPQQRPLIAIQICFDILRTRVAKGVFSKSGKIWNHLDEEAIPADTAVLLQRNGLRVARGKEDSWPPIKALLEEEKEVETSRDRLTIGNGLPLMLALDPRPRDQILFLFRPGGTLGGVSFPESTNFLRIEYDLSLSDPSALMVRVMPEIRLPRRPSRLPLRASGLPYRPWEQPARILHELAFEMEVGPDEFFVIGPSATAEQGHLAGSLLLCEEINGRPFESMYFITPRVLRTGRSAGP